MVCWTGTEIFKSELILEDEELMQYHILGFFSKTPLVNFITFSLFFTNFVPFKIEM